MTVRSIKEWVFYLRDHEGKETIVGEKTCKMPTRTKIWKELRANPPKGYRSFGVMIKSDYENDLKGQ